MQRQFKSALDRIEADDALVSRTDARLRKELAGVNNPTTFMKGRIYEMKKFAIAACLAVLLIGGGFVYATPTSYMCVDINPSIELGINALGRVVEAEATNDDGKAILAELDVEGMNLNRAVNLIIDAAVDKGFIEEDDTSFIELTAVTDDDKTAAKLLKYADEGTKEALEENDIDAEVGQAAISHARRDAAKAAGISPGKLNLLQKLWLAKDEDNQIPADADKEDLADIYDEILELENEDTDEAYADGSVKDIMKAIKQIRVEDKAELEDEGDADDDDDDDVTPGQGKANAPGQLKKLNADSEDENALLLPNGKEKKNGKGEVED